MPKIVADGANGNSGSQGFDFNTPGGAGVPGNNANCNFWDDDCAQVGGSGSPGVLGGIGGPGGNGGIGGVGGIGRNGGVIIVRTKNIADGGLATLNVSAGAGGRGGDPGPAGLPGPPGDDGSTTGVFSTSSECENMGPVPQWGAPGTNPVPPSLGNGAGGNQGTAQFLQIV